MPLQPLQPERPPGTLAAVAVAAGSGSPLQPTKLQAFLSQRISFLSMPAPTVLPAWAEHSKGDDGKGKGKKGGKAAAKKDDKKGASTCTRIYIGGPSAGSGSGSGSTVCCCGHLAHL